MRSNRIYIFSISNASTRRHNKIVVSLCIRWRAFSIIFYESMPPLVDVFIGCISVNNELSNSKWFQFNQLKCPRIIIQSICIRFCRSLESSKSVFDQFFVCLKWGIGSCIVITLALNIVIIAVWVVSPVVQWRRTIFILWWRYSWMARIERMIGVVVASITKSQSM